MHLIYLVFIRNVNNFFKSDVTWIQTVVGAQVYTDEFLTATS